MTRSIIMKDWEVRAILDRRKTVFRRPVKPGRDQGWLTQNYLNQVPHGEVHADKGLWQMHHPKAGQNFNGVDVAYDYPGGCVCCPYGVPGDTLWVRETWVEGEPIPCDCPPAVGRWCEHRRWEYRADWAGLEDDIRWCPSTNMPKWASRITLEVTDVRVERLWEVSDYDIEAEGLHVSRRGWLEPSLEEEVHSHDLQDKWHETWDTRYAKTPWSSNPWVWVVEFDA